jgi:hypothetical protein
MQKERLCGCGVLHIYHECVSQRSDGGKKCACMGVCNEVCSQMEGRMIFLEDILLVPAWS